MIKFEGNITIPGGKVSTYHEVEQIVLSEDAELLIVTLQSWGNEESRLKGFQADKHISNIPFASIPEAGALVSLIKDALTGASGALVGAIEKPVAGTLAGEKKKLLQNLKIWREQAISADLTTPHGVFQCRNKEDRDNIVQSYLLAKTLSEQSLPDDISFTLADNTVVLLDTAKLMQVSLLLGAQVNDAHSQYRTLRTAVNDATDIAELSSIVWM